MIDSEQGLQIVTVDRHDFDASDEALHDALMDAMRPVDATTLLPGAHFDATTGTFHNIIVDLDACEERVPHKIFGADWGHGAALIRLDGDNANQICEKLVSSVEERRKILDRALKDIANEVSDPNVEVGPNLACTELNRDLDEDVWQCGFDSPECSAGLYSTTEDTIPCGIGVGGMRPRRAFYLVVRAGAGKAAQQFHAKFVAATNDGSSMQDVLSSLKITDTDLARVVSAGKRNRARILLAFAKALGLDTEVDTTYDSAAAQDCRDQHAMVHMDVVTNVLVAPCDGKMTWRYHSGSIDPTRSTGIVMASTPTDGFVVCMVRSLTICFFTLHLNRIPHAFDPRLSPYLSHFYTVSGRSQQNWAHSRRNRRQLGRRFRALSR